MRAVVCGSSRVESLKHKRGVFKLVKMSLNDLSVLITLTVARNRSLTLVPSLRPDHSGSRSRGHQHPGSWCGSSALLHREQVGGHHAAPLWEPLCC